MKAVVCLRPGADGTLGPFDACAYEEALKTGADVTLLSMGAPSVKAHLEELTRRGAHDAVLLSDPAFAGADTLATARTLASFLRKNRPDLILCGRKTLIGDTGQTPLMLAKMLGISVLGEVLSLTCSDAGISCLTRSFGEQTAPFPCVVIVERISELRLPRLFSSAKSVTVLGAKELDLSPEECGLAGSPTRVIRTEEKQGGQRKCTFLPKEKFFETLETVRARKVVFQDEPAGGALLPCVAAVGEKAHFMAKTVCASPLLWSETDGEDAIAAKINENRPDAVLFANDLTGRTLASSLAARFSLGLCADCTKLTARNGELIMIRPASSGSVMATIRSRTRPALATVAGGESDEASVILSCGWGAKDEFPRLEQAARTLGAQLAASRKAVDGGLAPYEQQVGLSGKTVHPAVYIALGISGQVHHLVGMERSQTVIAVNPDREAPIFRYADYGFLISAKEWLSLFDAR